MQKEIFNSPVTLYYVSDAKNKLIATSKYDDSLFLLVGYNDTAYDNHDFTIPPYTFPSVNKEDIYNHGELCAIKNRIFTKDVIKLARKTGAIGYRFEKVEGNLHIILTSEHHESSIDISMRAYQRGLKFKFKQQYGVIKDIYLGYYKTTDERGCTDYQKIQ